MTLLLVIKWQAHGSLQSWRNQAQGVRVRLPAAGNGDGCLETAYVALTCGGGCVRAEADAVASRPFMRDSGHTESKASVRNSMTTSVAGRRWWLPSGSWPSCTARWKTAPPMAPACADAMRAPPA